MEEEGEGAKEEQVMVAKTTGKTWFLEKLELGRRM